MANQEQRSLHEKARDQTIDYNAQPTNQGQDDLRGGTQGGEPGRPLDPALKEQGTQGHTSQRGDVHVEQPSEYVPRTDLGSGS